MTRAISFAATTAGTGPSIPDVHAIPAPYAYRSPVGADGDDWWAPLLAIAFDLLDRECPNNLAAVIAEPMISAGGVIEMPPGYLKALKAGLEARGALLILDEAQTGLGKLGTLYAYQQHGVVPDIMTLSKHFGAGAPDQRHGDDGRDRRARAGRRAHLRPLTLVRSHRLHGGLGEPGRNPDRGPACQGPPRSAHTGVRAWRACSSASP